MTSTWEMWKADKKTASTDIVKPKPSKFQVKTNEAGVAKKDHVIGAIGKTTIVDARDAEFYEGKKKLDFICQNGQDIRSGQPPRHGRIQ